MTLDTEEVIVLNSRDARKGRMPGRLTWLVTAWFATVVTVSHMVAAEKPLPKHFCQPLIVEPPKVGAGDPVSNRCTDPSQPCYANNKDILRSQRTLLGIQDVIFYPIYNTDEGIAETIPYVQQTKNSGFGARVSLNNQTVLGNDSAVASKTVSARLVQGQGPLPVLGQFDLSDKRWLNVHIVSTQSNNNLDQYVDLGGRAAYDSINPAVFGAAADFAADGRD